MALVISVLAARQTNGSIEIFLFRSLFDFVWLHWRCFKCIHFEHKYLNCFSHFSLNGKCRGGVAENGAFGA